MINNNSNNSNNNDNNIMITINSCIIMYTIIHYNNVYYVL